ncbi:transposase [uncultured Amnibacterium sp.]
MRRWFASDADCLDYLDWLRWPEGFSCPRCAGVADWIGADGLHR